MQAIRSWRAWAHARRTGSVRHANPSRTWVEALEPRLFLTATFSNADLNGALGYSALNHVGEIVADGLGTLPSGSFTHIEGPPLSANLVSGSFYNVLQDGSVIVQLTSDESAADPPALLGAFNSTKDVVVLSSASPPDDPFADLDLSLLIPRVTGHTNANMAGTWFFATPDSRGSVNFDDQGNILNGSFNNDEGDTGQITGGTYNLFDDGRVNLFMDTDDPLDPVIEAFGTMNAAGDVMGLNASNLTSEDTDAGLGIAVRSQGAYSKADGLGFWTLLGEEVRGGVFLDGNGDLIAGFFFDIDGISGSLTGSYNVSPAGGVTVNITAQVVGEPSEQHRLAGTMNASRNIITLQDDDLSQGDSELLVLVRSNSNPLPDLAVSIQDVRFAGLPLGSATMVPGDKFTATVQIDNTSAAQANFSGNLGLQFFASLDDSLDESDLPLQAFSPKLTLPIASSVVRDFTLEWPANTPAGTYHILVLADSLNLVPEVEETANNLGASADTGQVQLVFGGVDERTVKLTVEEPDGTVVTFKLAGGGSAQVQPLEDGSLDLFVSDTNAKSTISITTKAGFAGADNTITIRNITVGPAGAPGLQGLAPLAEDDTALGKLIGKTARLIGELNAPAGLSNITLDQLDSGALINIGPAPNVPGANVTLVFNLVRNVTITSAIPIKSFTATQWIDDDESPDTLSAPALAKLTTKGNKKFALAGDFQADLTLTGPAVGSPEAGKPTLGSAKIAGAITGSAWAITGNAGAVTALGANAFALGVTGDLKSLKLGDVQQATLEIAGNAGAIAATQWLAGQMIAHTIKSIAIAGNTKAGIAGNFAADILLAGDPAVALDLGSFKVKAAITDMTLRTVGNVGAVSAASIISSDLFLGLPNDFAGLPAALADFDNPLALLKSLTVAGNKADPTAASFVNTRIAAGLIGKVKLQRVDTTNAGNVTGLAADTIAGVTALADDGTPLALVDGVITLTDFVVRNLA